MGPSQLVALGSAAAGAGLLVGLLWSRRALGLVRRSMKVQHSTNGRYIGQVSLRLHPVQEKVIRETEVRPMGMMLSSADQMQLLQMLVRRLGYKRCIDVGVFTGYSALSVGLALPDDGEVVACDISQEFMQIAEGYWREAGVDRKVRQMVGSAVESLQKLLDDGNEGKFDLIYIDADKQNYCNYFRLAKRLLRSGGAVAIDNTLWFGKAADSSVNDPDTVAIREVNSLLGRDPDFDAILLTVGDGIHLAFKK